MSSFKAVIFDMDGVISDSEPLYAQTLNQVLGTHGYALSESEYKEILGTTAEYTWQWLVNKFNLPGGAQRWMQKYDSAIEENLRENAVPSPGLYRLIDQLKARGLKLGLASSSQGNWVRSLLSALGVEGSFDITVSGEMVREGKPDPEIFLLTAQNLDTSPSHCLVIEDSPHGIRAAKDAGMLVVALLTPYTRDMDLSEADHVIDSLEQFDYGILDSASDR